MGGGKGGEAPMPDYTPVAQANAEAARLARETAVEQLDWAKEQYAMDREVTDQVIGQLLPIMEEEAANARADRERYNSVFKPMEDRLIAEAEGYDTPARRELEAGRAQADVAQAFEAQRQGALTTLQSYGVDPSMARAGALDTGVQTMRAALSAGAANNARLQTEATGRALRGEVINLGRGYQGQIAQAYQTAQGAGSSAVGAGLQTTATGAGAMGTGTQWSGQQQGFLSNWGTALNGQAGAANAIAQQKQAAGASTGALIGGIAGIAGAVLAPFTGGASLALSAAGAAYANSTAKGGR